VPLEMQAEAGPPAAPARDELSNQLGEVCRRCESYNEPGTARCTTCGYKLIPDEGDLEGAEEGQPAGEPPAAAGAAHAFAEHPPPSPAPAHMPDAEARELAAYALRAGDAADGAQGADSSPPAM